MAYIRLELFDLAEADSSVALLLDPRYVKAYSRRGLVRFKRGKYAEVCLCKQFAFVLLCIHKYVVHTLVSTADKQNLL